MNYFPFSEQKIPPIPCLSLQIGSFCTLSWSYKRFKWKSRNFTKPPRANQIKKNNWLIVYFLTAYAIICLNHLEYFNNFTVKVWHFKVCQMHSARLKYISWLRSSSFIQFCWQGSQPYRYTLQFNTQTNVNTARRKLHHLLFWLPPTDPTNIL